ncbi:E3 ubiquitin-protein ligase RNF135 isoform X2 [Heterocephalus glaber]|uniref:E3 ubiquitin-protein ligase RNF135 isoform X2 n=1 Tax=Heterocephalus glaber TaxID=10181 RepID=A0AAX6S7Z2_HETGA|nr:E3 ubiquitin-protein ligase RNF135 isoform X2 [Heterocephalus glaber]
MNISIFSCFQQSPYFPSPPPQGLSLLGTEPRTPQCEPTLYPEVLVQKSIVEVVQELTALVGKLVDITKSIQRQRPLSRPGLAEKALSSLASLTLMTSSTSEREMRKILRDLEEIQEKLHGNFSWKEAPEAQTQEAPSSSSCPRPDQSCLEHKRTSQFAQWAITPTFDLRSLSCSLEVSKDCRSVTVCHGQQNYPWSPQRFSASQVLCSQALSSGRQYWEVDTQYCNDWAVGVASWTMARNQMLGRTMDSWCIEWKGTGKLSAWTMAKETVLGSDRPGVVGIWLDLEEGKLAFYSVANQDSLIYECEVSAFSPLHPAFWLFGLRWGNSLIIKQARV